MSQPNTRDTSYSSSATNHGINSSDLHPHRKLSSPHTAWLPDQNQLYAYYINRCGHHGVRKPHRAVLALLTEDAFSREVRLAIEAAERGVAAAELAETEDAAAAAGATEAIAVGRTTVVVPLAEQRTFRLTEDSGAGLPIYVGARGMLPILDLLAELPLLTELDFSTIASFYDNDTVAQGQGASVTGNDVVCRLCAVLPRLRGLRTLNLQGHPIGCAAAERLLYAIRNAPTIVEVQLETRGLSTHLQQALQQTLRDHQETRETKDSPTTAPLSVLSGYVVPPYIAALPRLDRKTLREQQVLRAMLVDDVNFAAALTEAQLAEMVLTARVMSTTEAIFRCGKSGIRGDGVHLFLLKSGVLRVHEDLAGTLLGRGDYFGDPNDVTLVPCSRIVEEERGLVYAIPLTNCSPVLAAWAARVAVAWPWLQRTPLFQCVGSWIQLRACTCATMCNHESAKTVVEVGSVEGGLYVVCDGVYAALDARDGDTAQVSERNVRGVFSRYDVFGVEALVARKHTSSVRIKAMKEKAACYRVLHVQGCAVRLLQQRLRQVFVSLARGYSLHPDVCGEETHMLAS